MLLRSFVRYMCALGLVALSLAYVSAAKAVEVTSGFGFEQINFDWDTSPDANSTTGELTVDPTSMQSQTGLSAGYVNAYSGGQWIVRNMPLVVGDGASSTNFALPGAVDGVDNSSITAYVDYSATPTTLFSAAPTHNYGVGNDEYGADGDGAGDPSGPAAAPGSALAFNAGGANSLSYQFNHPNVDAARNQCAPAAAANNIQWLKDTYGLGTTQGATTYQNIKGLKGDPNNSLVGKLDVLMSRSGIAGASNTDANRRTGNGTNRVNNVVGMLQYFTDTSNTSVVVKNQGIDSDGSGLGGNYSNGTMTSQGQGDTLQFSFILSELQAGHAVQLMFKYPGAGGHAVEVVGAGTVLGVNWLWFKSDHIQTDDILGPLSGDGFGTDQLDWSRLDANNVLVDEKGRPTAQFVITETVPEPSSLILAGLAGALLATYRWRQKNAAAC